MLLADDVPGFTLTWQMQEQRVCTAGGSALSAGLLQAAALLH